MIMAADARERDLLLAGAEISPGLSGDFHPFNPRSPRLSVGTAVALFTMEQDA